MIKIYDDSKALGSILSANDNGLGNIDVIDGVVDEELNSLYEAEFTVSPEEKHFNLLKVGGIIGIDTSEGHQMFRIYYISKPIDDVVRIRAQHITYDLLKIVVKPFSARGISDVLSGLISHIIGGTYPFTFSTDISNSSSTFSLTIPRSLRECLGGYEGSLLDVFRGEYKWDNLNVEVLERRGADNGVSISYGKNLADYKHDEDDDSVYTSVLCYAVVDDVTYYGNVYHKVNVDYPRVKIVDLTADYESGQVPTISGLTNRAQEYANANDIELPKANITVEFVPLWQTEEYKNIAPLESVKLGDTVHIRFDKMGVEASSRVVKTVWNINTQRFDKVELGSLKTNMASLLDDQADQFYSLTSIMQTQISVNDEHITALASRVNDVETDVSTVTQTAETLSGTVSSLQTTVDSSIATVAYTYGYGTSDTTHPADSAFTYSSMPARVDGQYIWRKMVTTTNAGTTTTKYEMVQGADGASGTSVYIASQVVDYLESASGTTVPSGTWSTTIPDVADGNYLWTRTTVNYSDNTSTVSYSVARQGENGEEGSQIWTTTTAPTTPNYTFTISNLQGDSNVSPKIGDVIMYSYYRYTISSVSSSTVLCSTRQSLRGANGTSYYTYVRYSANSDGSSMTTAPNANTKYIGIYTGTSSTVPAYTEFTWSQYVGESVTVSEVMYASGTSGTTAPSSGWQASVPSVSQGDYLWTRTTYSDGQIVYTVARQGEDGANGTSVTVSGYTIQYAASSSGTTVPTSGWGNTPTATNGQYQWSRTTTSYSPSGTTITYSVAYIGTNGEDGDDGVGIEKIEEIRYLQLSEENTVSGRIATIDDAYEMDANSVVVDIDPIQDFNGYDHPWIGGAGKNKFQVTATSQTVRGITFTVNTDGSVKADGTATANVNFVLGSMVVDAQSYLLNGISVSANDGHMLQVTNEEQTSQLYTCTSGDTTMVFSTSQTIVVRWRIVSGTTVSNYTIYPMVRLSSVTDTSFEPYENICPISGRTTVKTNTAGKNLLPYPFANTTIVTNGITFTDNRDGTITANGTATGLAQFYITNFRDTFGTYCVGKTLTGCPSGGSTGTYWLCLQKDGSSDSIWTVLARDTGNGVTIGSNAAGVRSRILFQISSGTTVSNLVIEPMLRISDTDATYEPYEGTTYNTALGQTVYGGTLDLVSGLLTIKSRYITISDFTGFSTGTSTGGLHWVDVPTTYPASTSGAGNKCSHAAYATNGWLSKVPMLEAPAGNGIYPARIYVSSSSLAAFQTEYADLQAVYLLATPTTVQLTAQEVMLLRGINNIWADSGEVEVKYYTDPSVQLNAPALPSSVVTSLSTDEEQWTLAMPTYQARALYWLSLQTKFTDNTYSWGDAVPDSGVTDSFAMTQNLQTVLTKTRVELNASIQELSDRITSVVSEVDTIQDSYIDANGVEQILSTKEYATQSDVTQMSDSITVRFDEYVKYDDTEYQSLVTNILFNEEGINISASTIDTNLQLAADGVYIQDTGGDAIASMTATQFSTGDWVMQQSDYIFNIFKEHNS